MLKNFLYQKHIYICKERTIYTYFYYFLLFAFFNRGLYVETQRDQIDALPHAKVIRQGSHDSVMPFQAAVRSGMVGVEKLSPI
jgi:hypothetical protein